MNFVQTFKMALKSIGSNKSRTALTMLGIIIGVCAVIVLVGVVKGSTNMVMDNFRDLGTNLVQMQIIKKSATRKVTVADMDRFQEKNKDIMQGYTPYISGQVTAKYETRNKHVSVNGINHVFLEFGSMELTSGRNLNALDVERNQKVAMVDKDVIDNVFDGNDPMGKELRLNGEVFRVIGVLKSKSSMGMGMGPASGTVYIPYTTAEKLLKVNDISLFALQSYDDTQQKLANSLKVFLYNKFRDADAYMVVSSEEMLNMVDSMMGTLTNVLAGVAAISLLVGGIGIMNIMLVSVSERTREIGIRKAIGAKRRSILMQFLVESVVVSSMGGIVGIIIGIVLANALAGAMSLTAAVEPGIIVFSFVFSMAVGVFFGLYPANKASKLNPIDALRHE